MKVHYALLFVALVLIGCADAREKPSETNVDLPVPKKAEYGAQLELEDTVYYDKVLGAIVGSAIGDAMGASTEMWNRWDIQREYGYINGLTSVDIPRQAEGPWGSLLGAGTTTDDTRWKYFMGKYFTVHANELGVDSFTDMIVAYYQSQVQSLNNEALKTNPDLLDDNIQRIDWIKEWARVALTYKEGGAEFERAKNRFYGGEMSCAGMLYTPMFGLISAKANDAYTAGYDHALFDIGYAKDISGVVAAMTQLAMGEDSMEVVLEKSLLIDPYGYTDSRLVGRLVQNIVDESKGFISSARELPEADTTQVKKMLKGYMGSRYDWLQQDHIYTELTTKQRAIAFHAGEIFQILYTALLFGESNFEKTMAFIVNYGRDSDTVAAVAGMVLGAHLGYAELPQEMKETVIRVNRDLLGIDLEQVAKEVVAAKRSAESVN